MSTPAPNLDAIRGRITITVQEAAALLGCQERTLRRSIEAGEVPSIRIGGRTVVPVPRLLALIEGEPAATVTALPGPPQVDVTAAVAEILRGALAAVEQLTAAPRPREDSRSVA